MAASGRAATLQARFPRGWPSRVQPAWANALSWRIMMVNPLAFVGSRRGNRGRTVSRRPPLQAAKAASIGWRKEWRRFAANWPMLGGGPGVSQGYEYVPTSVDGRILRARADRQEAGGPMVILVSIIQGDSRDHATTSQRPPAGRPIDRLCRVRREFLTGRSGSERRGRNRRPREGRARGPGQGAGRSTIRRSSTSTLMGITRGRVSYTHGVRGVAHQAFGIGVNGEGLSGM